MIINKSENKPRVNKEKLYPFLSIFISCYLALSVIIFFIYLIAPLVGGKLSLSALTVYGSNIGMALGMKFFLKKKQRKIRLKGYEYFGFCAYCIFCAFVWFSYPLNILFSILIILGNVSAYRGQVKSS